MLGASARSWACQSPHFCTRAFTLGSQDIQPTGILRMMKLNPCFNFIARQVFEIDSGEVKALRKRILCVRATAIVAI